MNHRAKRTITRQSINQAIKDKQKGVKLLHGLRTIGSTRVNIMY